MVANNLGRQTILPRQIHLTLGVKVKPASAKARGNSRADLRPRHDRIGIAAELKAIPSGHPVRGAARSDAPQTRDPGASGAALP
jgi:hypothetical protein